MTAYVTFQEQVNEELESTLRERGYQFREEIAGLSPPEVPDDFYLPFTKSLERSMYSHIVLSHSYVPRETSQEFEVLLLRYEGIEPWASMATPVPGRSRHNITGYLPGLECEPLPLIRERHNARRQWQFQTDSELHTMLQIIRQRLLDTVLPWIESPVATQFILVQKEWYAEPFETYITGVSDAAASYKTICLMERPGYWIDAGDVEETYLVNEVTRILYQLQLSDPINRPSQILLEYLLSCLKAEQKFTIRHYREMKSSLFKM